MAQLEPLHGIHVLVAYLSSHVARAVPRLKGLGTSKLRKMSFSEREISDPVHPRCSVSVGNLRLFVFRNLMLFFNMRLQLVFGRCSRCDRLWNSRKRPSEGCSTRIRCFRPAPLQCLADLLPDLPKAFSSGRLLKSESLHDLRKLTCFRAFGRSGLVSCESHGQNCPQGEPINIIQGTSSC